MAMLAHCLESIGAGFESVKDTVTRIIGSATTMGTWPAIRLSWYSREALKP